jgi:hypothetical protein
LLLFVFVRHSGAARISVVAFVAPLHFRIPNASLTESIFCQQHPCNEYFAGATQQNSQSGVAALVQ